MNANNPSQTPQLRPTAEVLLKAAERLYAEQGLGVVSTRQIAREAGQKNHSAINYHFGDEASLIEAILDYRMIPLNLKRAEQVNRLRDAGLGGDIRELVKAIVEPFATELLRDEHDSYYLSLLAQLINRDQWSQYFTSHPQRSGAIMQAAELIITQLSLSIPKDIATYRLSLMGRQVIRTVADWDAERRSGEGKISEDSLNWQLNNLIDYLVGALAAPVMSQHSIPEEL